MDGIVTASEFNNLKQDLLSIHDTIGQIFGKVGALQTVSWKLREESAGDLPVEMLCNKCQYFSSDLHSTRASHIMLLELIIDRLALMLQSYLYFTDRLVGKPASRTIEAPPNLGPLCKKYWKKAKLLRQYVSSLQAEVEKKNQELVHMGMTLDQAYEENTLLKDMVVKHGLAPGYETPRRKSNQFSTPPKTAGSVQWSEFSSAAKIEEEDEMADSAVDIAVRSSTTSMLSQSKLPTQITVNNMKTVSKWLLGGQTVDAKTQTIETAFVECNVCCSIQELLEGLGSRMTITWNMLMQQSIPPKRLLMTPPREAIKWCQYHTGVITEVDEKVRGVQRHSIELENRCQSQSNNIHKLESNIAVLTSELESLQSQHSSGMSDSNKRESLLRQQISKQAVEYHHNLELRRVEEERMREKMAGLEKKLAEYQDKYFCEATSKRRVMDELARVREEAARAEEMRETCSKLEEQISALEDQHYAATDEINRHQCRNDQLIKQNKMLTIKQGQLLSQLEAFDTECENMRDQLEAARDSSTNTTFQLTDVVKEKDLLHNENNRLQESISRIQKDITTLTQTLSLTDRKLTDAQKIIEEERDKEITLISYPLLVEGERIPRELNRLVQANNIRILRLEEQNRLLRDSALQKELIEAHPEPDQKPKEALPLWSNKCFKELVKSQHIFERVFTPIDYYDGIKSLVDAHGKLRPGSCPDQKNGPSTPDKVIPPHNSPHPASRNHNTSHPSVNAWSGSNSLNSQRVNYSCQICGKGFSAGSDLEIHQIYCQ